jgi:hypothetical protein
MARKYHTVIPPRRRWGLAVASGLTLLAVTLGAGNQWSWSYVSRLSQDAGLNRVPLLARTLLLLQWQTTPGGFGGEDQTGRFAAALVLDLGWPLLLFICVRMLSAGLGPRRGGLPLLVGTWGLTAFTGALAGLAAGTTDYLVSGHLQEFSGVLGSLPPGSQQLGDLLTLLAATTALLGLAIGWLPALVAVIGYSVRRGRTPVAADEEESGEETTIVDLNRPILVGAVAERETLNLAALEALRNARYTTEPENNGGGLADPRTSIFFDDGQY